MKKLLFFLFIIFCQNISRAQLYVGAGYGTYNIPGMSTGSFKGMSPVLNLTYMPDGYTGSQLFLNASMYSKNVNSGIADVYDDNGNMLGSASSETHYRMKQFQIGFAGVFGSREQMKLPKFFAGGGVALLHVENQDTYELNGAKTTTEKYTRLLYGFHFNAGLQYQITPVVIQLKGNFDFMLKQIEKDATGESGYFLFGTKLGLLVPLSKVREKRKVNTKATSSKKVNTKASK